MPSMPGTVGRSKSAAEVLEAPYSLPLTFRSMKKWHKIQHNEETYRIAIVPMTFLRCNNKVQIFIFEM